MHGNIHGGYVRHLRAKIDLQSPQYLAGWSGGQLPYGTDIRKTFITPFRESVCEVGAWRLILGFFCFGFCFGWPGGAKGTAATLYEVNSCAKNKRLKLSERSQYYLYQSRNQRISSIHRRLAYHLRDTCRLYTFHFAIVIRNLCNLNLKMKLKRKRM